MGEFGEYLAIDSWGMLARQGDIQVNQREFCEERETALVLLKYGLGLGTGLRGTLYVHDVGLTIASGAQIGRRPRRQLRALGRLKPYWMAAFEFSTVGGVYLWVGFVLGPLPVLLVDKGWTS